MMGVALFALALACFALAAAGCLHTLAAAALVARFRRDEAPIAPATPGVTILKPVRGAEAGLDT